MKIVIPGIPIAKMRARTVRKKGFTMTYDPQEGTKKTIKWLMKVEYHNALNSNDTQISSEAAEIIKAESVVVNFEFYMPVPESESSAQKNLKYWGMENHNKKPDCSNMIKFYEDCANGILFSDDSKIICGSFLKKYSKNPRTEIEIVAKKKFTTHKKVEDVLKVFSIEDIKEFLSDAEQLSVFRQIEIDKLSSEDRSKFYLTATCVLTSFAHKYVTKLKRIIKDSDCLPEHQKSEMLVAMEGKVLC